VKTTELRIGNYVSHYVGDDLKVDVIADVGYHLLSSPKSITSRKDNDVIKSLEPIPLTEEWLLNFGFASVDYGEYKKDRYILDCEYTDKGVYYFIIDDVCIEADILYVHQLQNLYFALTSEELKLKDNEQKERKKNNKKHT